MKAADSISPQLVALRDVLDAHSVQYRDLAGAKDFGEYAVSKQSREAVSFGDQMGQQQAEIVSMLDLGTSMVEAVERLVCRLYGVPRMLEDGVVASAVARAAMSG